MRLRVLVGGATTALLLAVTGCASAHAATPLIGAAPEGKSVHSIVVGKTIRTYRLYVPHGLTGAAPLVVMMHGGYGDAQQAESAYGWDEQADKGRFVVAYPNGQDKSWNAGTCCGPSAGRDVDDVSFIHDMVLKIAADRPIDRSRIYATGMSNGAMMAYRMACQTSLFVAIAPVAGTIMVPCANGHPTSVLHIHGLADDRVPYGGGPGKAYSITGAARVDGPSIPADNATWRAIDGCSSPTVSTVGLVTTSVAACDAGRNVALISIAGAGHQWPGSKPNTLGEKLLGLDPPSKSMAATPAIWTFFAAHSRPY